MKIEHMTKPEQKIVSITRTVAVAKLPEYIGPTFMKLVAYIEARNARVQSAPFVSFTGRD